MLRSVPDKISEKRITLTWLANPTLYSTKHIVAETQWAQFDDIFKCTFLNENVGISIEISLKFILKGPMNNIPALVQIMARHRPGDRPLSQPMMIILGAHICITRSQWVKEWMNRYKNHPTQLIIGFQISMLVLKPRVMINGRVITSQGKLHVDIRLCRYRRWRILMNEDTEDIIETKGPFQSKCAQYWKSSDKDMTAWWLTNHIYGKTALYWMVGNVSYLNLP